MKCCSACGENKELTDFQVREASNDGSTAACRVCLQKRDKRRYPKEARKRAEDHKTYMTTRSGKSAHKRATRKWLETSRLERAAHIILDNAVRDGKVTKGPCGVCGSTRRIHGHHDDYSKPLEVRWLCPKHHKEYHAKAKSEAT